MATQDKKTKKMSLKIEVPQVIIDRYYADALAGKNDWEIVYAQEEDEKQKYKI